MSPDQQTQLSNFIMPWRISFGAHKATQLQVFGFAAGDTLAPHFETAGFHACAHQFNGLRLIQTKLKFYGFKWRSIFPGHFYNAGNIFFGQLKLQRLGHLISLTAKLEKIEQLVYDRRGFYVKRALLSLIVLITLVIVVFFGLGLYSETGSPPGMANGQLAPCPNKPNCVSSESSPSDDHSIAALPIKPSMGEEPLLKAKEVVELLGGEVNFSNEQYMASTFDSDFFGFVDDVEFRVDQGSGLLHVRSASRVGYSDLGANRKRVEQIRILLSTN